MPTQRSSAPKAWAVYCGPQSVRHGQAARHVLAEPAEGIPHALVERLERRPPIAPLGRLPAHELVGRVIDRPEEPAPAVALGPAAGAPELVGPPSLQKAKTWRTSEVGRYAAVRATGPLKMLSADRAEQRQDLSQRVCDFPLPPARARCGRWPRLLAKAPTRQRRRGAR